MGAQFLGQIIGAFLVTFLISRFVLWLLRRWDGGVNKLGAAHGVTLAFLWTLYAFGSADGGPLNWSGGFVYALPTLVWFVMDIVRGTGDVEPSC